MYRLYEGPFVISGTLHIVISFIIITTTNCAEKIEPIGHHMDMSSDSIPLHYRPRSNQLTL